ncbi:MAG: HAD-IIIC family phosphatase, partial [Nanoarchaeota archaeon]
MQKIKLVVWDLDNTLWNGTVYYQDKDSVKLKPGTKEALKELSKRNIKNTICSKNYYEDVEVMLEKFEIKKFFDSAEVNWGLKSDNIRKLMKKYDVLPNEVCFVDDDAFQRAEVLSQIPDLKAIELGDPLDILSLHEFKLENETEEDKERVKILKEQRNREEAEKNHKGDYKEFLKSCDINMTIRPVEEKDWERVVQLFNRTNEMNTTGNRYELNKLKKQYEDGEIEVYVSELTDKFGDYGLIAECIIDTRTKDWEIKDLTVSCRTMGRGIGSALLIAMMNYALERDAKTIRGILREIESNWRMKPLYLKRGFKVIKKKGNETTYGY